MEGKNIIYNIKCDFFIPKIFEIIPKNITFRIINYNKKLQKILNINIKDFIEIYEIYGPTRIEIIPIKNNYGKFINVKEVEKKYFHIYFNDNKEETKNKYYINEEDKITKIKIKIEHKVKTLSKLFNGCKCIESIDFKKYCRKKGNFKEIFSFSSSLKELSLSDFYNNEFTDMFETFKECSSLQKINFNNFYNNKANNIFSTFQGCPLLKEVNASNFYNNEISNIFSIFRTCPSLKKVNASNFYHNEVNNMYSTFEECSSLEEVNLSNFYNNKLSKMFSTFKGCSSLKKVNASYFCNNKMSNMYSTFKGCYSLRKVNISYFYNNEVNNIYSTFEACSSLN